MSCWTRIISSYLAHKFKSNRHTHIAEVRQHFASARLPVGRQMLAGQTSHPQSPPVVAQRPHRHGCRAATDWPLAPCCLVPVGREDNALSSVRLRLSWTQQSSLTCVFSWNLAEVGLMERVKICFTIIRQHQDRCLSAWNSRLIGMEERTKGASHETTVYWQKV